MKTCTLLVVAFLATGSLLARPASGVEPAGLGPAWPGPRVELKLARGGDNLFAKARVGDADAGWFFVSLGGDRVLVDTLVAKRLGLPVARANWPDADGDPRATLVVLNRLGLGPLAIPPHLAVATDLKRWRDEFGVDLSGSLGWAFLGQFPFTVDFRAATLTLYDPTRFSPPGKPAVEQPVRLIDGVPAALAKIDRTHSGWLTLQTALGVPFGLSRTFVNLHPEMFLDVPRPGAAIDDYTASRFESLEALGKLEQPCVGSWELTIRTSKLTPPPPRLDAAASGEIGGPFLRDLRVTFDRGASRMWVERLAPEGAREVLARLGESAPDLAGVTALTRVASLGSAEAAGALLGRGADVNAADHFGRTALMAACETGHPDLVKLLLDRGAKPGAADAKGHTPLMRAAAGGDAETARLLLAAGAEADAVDSAGQSALHDAAGAGRPDVIDALLDRHADLNRCSATGLTPLRIAVILGNRAAAEALLRHKASVADSAPAATDDATTGSAAAGAVAAGAGVPGGGGGGDHDVSNDSRTPLMDAAALNRTDMLRLLLRDGSDVNAKSAGGRTALMWASVFGRKEAARLLLAAGADPAAKAKDGKSVLDYAIDVSDIPCANIIYAAIHGKPVVPAVGARLADGSAEVTARRGGSTLYLPVSLAGRGAGWMELDTGADGVTIDAALAERLHFRILGKNQSSGVLGLFPSKIVEVPRIAVGSIEIGPLLATATDLKKFRGGRDERAGGRDVAFMGVPFPDGWAFTLDYVAGKVGVQASPAKPPPGATAFPLRDIAHLHCVRAAVCGEDEGLFAIDTCWHGPGGLSGPYLSLHPELFGGVHGVTHSGLADGETAREPTIALSTLSLLDKVYFQLRAEAPLDLALGAGRNAPGFVGEQLFQSSRLTFDPAAGRLWVWRVPDDETTGAYLKRTAAYPDLWHTTQLRRAIDEDRPDAVRVLLEQDADPNEPDLDGTTPLAAACRAGHDAIVELLLRKGAKRADGSAIETAAAYGSPQLLRRLLGQDTASLDGETSCTLLALAASGGNVGCVEALLEAGANPNALPDSRWPLLTLCCPAGGEAPAEAMLKHGADVNAAAPDGTTALLLATRQENLPLVRILLARGATVDARDGRGRTALMYAAEAADAQAVQVLLAAGANPLLKDASGDTALERAAAAKKFRNAELCYFAQARVAGAAPPSP